MIPFQTLYFRISIISRIHIITNKSINNTFIYQLSPLPLDQHTWPCLPCPFHLPLLLRLLRPHARFAHLHPCRFSSFNQFKSFQSRIFQYIHSHSLNSFHFQVVDQDVVFGFHVRDFSLVPIFIYIDNQSITYSRVRPFLYQHHHFFAFSSMFYFMHVHTSLLWCKTAIYSLSLPTTSLHAYQL